MKTLTICIILLAPALLIAQEAEIRKVLEDQTACWNKGDLECFMAGYVNSDELVFVGSTGPKYGWQVTLNNYKSSYPNKDAMGTLKFDLLKFKPLGKKNYLVIGKWTLVRQKDTPTGHFSLVFEKINGEWKIIADHSS
jgi:ketosteroid isomerase-like protein